MNKLKKFEVHVPVKMARVYEIDARNKLHVKRIMRDMEDFEKRAKFVDTLPTTQTRIIELEEEQ